jgi:hypothetical protein
MNEQIRRQKVGSINVGQTVRIGNEIQGFKFLKVTKVIQQNPHYYRIDLEGESFRRVVGASTHFEVVYA